MSKRTKVTPRLANAVTPRLEQSPRVTKGVSSSRIILPPVTVDSAETVGASVRKQSVMQPEDVKKGGANAVKRTDTVINVKPEQKGEKKIAETGVYTVEIDDEEELDKKQEPHRIPHDNIVISCIVFWGCFGWPLGIILSLIARRANMKKNYDKSDCYGKIALYTNIMIMALGICGYLALFIHLDQQ